jgi:hypothetical protein
LSRDSRALLVEEDVGRVFCGEECIAKYFAPEIERLEREYFRVLSRDDLSGEQREKLAHLRWVTLEEPDELWREKTLSGDYRYTLISEFEPGDETVWCICICLFLRGEPSFLYIAFPTRSAALVDHYRRGERMEWSKEAKTLSQADKAPTVVAQEVRTDGIAESWASEAAHRLSDDVPLKEFERLQGKCMDPTLEAPDEVWMSPPPDEGGQRVFHFIKRFSNLDGGIWYVIKGRETGEAVAPEDLPEGMDDGSQIEILEAFPTRDAGMVARYRQGVQEVGESNQAGSGPGSHTVH